MSKLVPIWGLATVNKWLNMGKNEDSVNYISKISKYKDNKDVHFALICTMKK